MEPIFFEDQDEITGRYLIVEEDENSIWAYLTFPNEIRIEKSCFLCSRNEIKIQKFDFEEFRKKQIPPPMTLDFATAKSHQHELTVDDISVKWGVGEMWF